MDDVVWTVDEAAKHLKISKALAYQMCRTGEIKCVHYNKRILVPVAALLESLSGNTQTS